jgi:hypothetical protein
MSGKGKMSRKFILIVTVVVVIFLVVGFWVKVNASNNVNTVKEKINIIEDSSNSRIEVDHEYVSN